MSGYAGGLETILSKTDWVTFGVSLATFVLFSRVSLYTNFTFFIVCFLVTVIICLVQSSFKRVSTVDDEDDDEEEETDSESGSDDEDDGEEHVIRDGRRKFKITHQSRQGAHKKRKEDFEDTKEESRGLEKDDDENV